MQQAQSEKLLICPGTLLRPSLLILLLTITWSCYLNAQTSSDSTLIIYGTGGITNYDLSFNQAFLDALGPTLGATAVPEVINLHLATERQRANYAESLRIKYRDTNLPVVVTLFADAEAFVSDYGNVFAPNAIHIHVLPGESFVVDASPESDNEQHYSVPSVIQSAVRETAGLINRLYPQLDTLYVLSGAGFTDRSYLERYRNTLSELDLPFQIEYLVGLPVTELLTRISALRGNNALLMATYDVDRDGTPSTTRGVARTLSNQFEIPVFANISDLIEVGSVGGSITPTASYAQAAAALVNNALSGTPPVAPVIAETRYQFNGAMLDRFQINRALLPPGSEIINDVPNLWRDYGNWIVLGLAIIVAQLVLISLLLLAVRRRKAAEAKLLAVSKLEALGNLAGGIAHDFNNILMAMMANAELASLDADNADKVKSRLKQLLLAGNRAKGLVAQILMFSRDASIQLNEDVDMVQLVSESIEQIQSLISDSCSVSCDYALDTAWVRGNPNQLHQSLMNICINAKHAMEDGGKLRIEVKEKTIGTAQRIHNQIMPAGTYVSVLINDTGKGISPEHLPHIFEPFYTTKPSGKGTGLGLALVYRIIKAHDGYIDVSSSLNEGTTFTIYLTPIARPESPAIPVLQGSAPRGHGEHILLVDDDQMVLDTNRQCLQELGYRVTAFGSSLDALHTFKADPLEFDLVYTDLSMPEMDGVRLATTIRQSRADIGIVLNTGYLDAVDNIDIENLRLLSKPADINQIATAVAEALSNSSGH
ncbi:MAG: hypothetical protein PsegKO_25130 [Pseudohongiellaceae bacterium]